MNQAVKRNLERFPADFLSCLTPEEKEEVVTNRDHLSALRFARHIRSAFTEHGAAALTAGERALQYVRMLLDYIDAAMKTAAYEKLEDGTYSGTIRRCPGVIAFAATLYECQDELRSVLEDWLIVKLRHGDTLPVLGRVNLNRGLSRHHKTAARA